MKTNKQNFIHVASQTPEFRSEAVTKTEIRDMLDPASDGAWTPRWRRVAQALRKTFDAWKAGVLTGVSSLRRVCRLCVNFVRGVFADVKRFVHELDEILEETLQELLNAAEVGLDAMGDGMIIGSEWVYDSICGCLDQLLDQKLTT